jgi:hypothetical protein
MRSFIFGAAAVLALGLGATTGAQAAAGFIALEGSDATAFHQDASYTPQLMNYLDNGTSVPILVYDPTGTITLANPGSASLVYTTTLVGVTLSDFSALYIESPGGCCSADNTVLNGFGAEVNAFIAAGGNLSIENYNGGDYDGVVPGGIAPAGSIDGVGTATGPFCTDGERVNAIGMLKGFTQPPIDGCWSHQGYENSYWLAQGYISLIDSATDATDAASGGFGGGGFTFGDGTQIGSSLLAIGGTLGAPVPEPESIAMFGIAVVGMAALRRRRR